MAFQPVPGVYQAEVRYTWDGIEVENVLAFRHTGPATQEGVDSLAVQLELWATTEYLPLVSNTVTFREVYVKDLEANPFLTGLSNSEAGTTGSQTSPSLPNQTTKSILFRSNVSGRSARGANRIIGLVEAQVTGRSVASGVLDLFLTAYTRIPLYVGPIGCTQTIVSRYANKVKRAVGTTFDVFSYGFPHSRVGTTRSRMT